MGKDLDRWELEPDYGGVVQAIKIDERVLTDPFYEPDRINALADDDDVLRGWVLADDVERLEARATVKSLNVRLAKHLTFKEFRCPCGECEFGPATVELLRAWQKLRARVDRPIHVNSGFRCRAHNDSLKNSSPNSRHLSGNAMDLSWKGLSFTLLDRQDIGVLVTQLGDHGFKGVGLGKGYIHVDTRPDVEEFVWEYLPGGRTVHDQLTSLLRSRFKERVT